MAKASVRVNMRAAGASIQTVARELKRMDDRQIKETYRRKLEEAARPYPARVRASVLAIPVKEDGRHTGLRARIAGCVSLSSGTDADSGWVSVWVDVRKMEPDYKTLPLYMQGVNEGRKRRYDRWRHPVFGRRDNPNDWQPQASHPYFRQATDSLGRAAGEAIRRALDDITRKISG